MISNTFNSIDGQPLMDGRPQFNYAIISRNPAILDESLPEVEDLSPRSDSQTVRDDMISMFDIDESGFEHGLVHLQTPGDCLYHPDAGLGLQLDDVFCVEHY